MGGDVSVLPGLASSESLTITSSGQGDVTGLFNVTNELTIDSSGQGEIDVGGQIGSLAITITGQGDTFISGTNGLSITGSNEGMGDLSYEGGECSVPNGFFSSNGVKSSGASPPNPTLPDATGRSIYSAS